MIGFCFANLLLAAVLSIPGINAVTELRVHRNVVARRGSKVTLICLGSGVDKLDTSIVWKFNNKTVEDSSNRRIKEEWLSGYDLEGRFSLNIVNVSEKDVGEYQCIAEVDDFKSGSGFVKTESLLIQLQLFQSILNITASQPNVIIEEGSTTSLQCVVTCSEAIDAGTFWLFNGEMIKAKPAHSKNDGALSNRVTNVSSTLELKHVTLAQSGTYTCGANSTDILITQNISVKVKDIAGPAFVDTEATVTVLNGKNATLSCVAVYPAALFVDTFWIFNGSRIYSNNKYAESNTWFRRSQGSIQRRIRLVIYSVGLDDIGQYTCVFNTSHGVRKKNISVHFRMEKNHTNHTKEIKLAKGNADLLEVALFLGLGLFVGLLTTIAVSLKLWRRQKRRPPESIISLPDMDERDFKYDVFITYSRKDFSWVDKELLPLFNNNHVKYCVDLLHFELGKAFLESMVEGVYQSRKVLAIWSENYASSKYCKQEMDYALQKSFENSDSSVIVIRLDGTDRKQLPKPLRARTFLDYSDSAERKGWDKRLIKYLKPPKQIIVTMV